MQRFICHKSICRSPMVEFIIKNLAKKASRPLRKHAHSRASQRFHCNTARPSDLYIASKLHNVFSQLRKSSGKILRKIALFPVDKTVDEQEYAHAHALRGQIFGRTVANHNALLRRNNQLPRAVPALSACTLSAASGLNLHTIRVC